MLQGVVIKIRAMDSRSRGLADELARSSAHAGRQRADATASRPSVHGPVLAIHTLA